MRAPISVLTISSIVSKGTGSTSSCSRLNASRYDGRQQVGSCRQQLAELDEGGAHRLELVDELARVVADGRVVIARIVGVKVAKIVAAPMLEQERGNLFVASKMVDLQRQSHGCGDRYPLCADSNRSVLVSLPLHALGGLHRPTQQLGGRRRRARAGEVEALGDLAAETGDDLDVGGRLDAFNDHTEL